MKFYEWTVKIRVADTWVADGFDLTAERLHAMVRCELPHAYDHEIEVDVVVAPAPAEVRKEQGYGGGVSHDDDECRTVRT